MQIKWFRSIDNFDNFFFILRFKGLKVGLGNIKNIDWEELSGETGVFIAEKQNLSSFLPVVGVLTLSDLVFRIFKLKKLYSHVRPDNKRAVRFNTLFGYKRVAGEEGEESQLYELTTEMFKKATRKFFLLMKPLGYKTGNMIITLHAQDYLTDFGPQMEKKILDSGMNFKVSKVGEKVIFTEV